jgi:RecA/RadA recombinase
MAKKVTSVSSNSQQTSFNELNDILNKISPNGDILEDSIYARIDEWIPTGSYILNAALSGSLFGGLPNRRSLALAGEEQTAKTFIALSICRNAQSMNYNIIYCDTEGAIDIDFVKRLGVDPKRFRIENISTVEEFATLTAKLNESIKGMRDSGKTPPKIMLVLDSLGNLSSAKEKADTTSGSDKRDMTKQQAIRRTFRVIGNDLAMNAIPFIIVGHVYEKVGSYIPGKEVSGGGGIKYNASVIFMLTKSKLTDKDSEDHVKNQNIEGAKVGTVITINPIKQRFARPIKVQIHIPYYKRPNPYVGLEKFISWKTCGIIRGKALTEKEYSKMKPNEQSDCFEYEIIENKKGEDTKIKMYAYPKDTARTLVCKHLGGEVPLAELYTDKVFTQEVLTQLDNNIIKPTFCLPNIESLDDLAEVTSELIEGNEMNDADISDDDSINNIAEDIE